MRWAIAIAAAAVTAAMGAAYAQAQTIARPQPPPGGPPPGYLGENLPDTMQILPPAPAKGDARDAADRRIFRETRALKGTPRWTLAFDDDHVSVLTQFSCAAGIELSRERNPKLYTLLLRVGHDFSAAGSVAKDGFHRPRPFLVDKGATCIPQSDPSLKSFDYPSGHATTGWTFGLMLTELAPDRATPILVRARAYTESRYVCGVHSLSAVEAGRTTATVVWAAEHGSAEFRRDLEDARAELAAARATAPKPDPAACAREAALLASPK
jgi:acid phosphatase (class A)